MGYSTALTQAISIVLLIHGFMEECDCEFLPTKTISEHAGIPHPTTVKTLKSLNLAGITLTKEGSKGGILLSRPISEITLFDIFTALEHDSPLFKVQTNFLCQHDSIDHMKTRVMDAFQMSEDAMKTVLKNTTLSYIYYGKEST